MLLKKLVFALFLLSFGFSLAADSPWDNPPWATNITIGYASMNLPPGLNVSATYYRAINMNKPFRLLDSQFASVPLQSFFVLGSDLYYNGNLLYKKGTVFGVNPSTGAYMVSAKPQIKFQCAAPYTGSDTWNVSFLSKYTIYVNGKGNKKADFVLIRSYFTQAFKFFDDGLQFSNQYFGVVANDKGELPAGKILWQAFATVWTMSEYDTLKYMQCVPGAPPESTTSTPSFSQQFGLILLSILILLAFLFVTQRAERTRSGRR